MSFTSTSAEAQSPCSAIVLYDPTRASAQDFIANQAVKYYGRIVNVRYERVFSAYQTLRERGHFPSEADRRLFSELVVLVDWINRQYNISMLRVTSYLNSLPSVKEVMASTPLTRSSSFEALTRQGRLPLTVISRSHGPVTVVLSLEPYSPSSARKADDLNTLLSLIASRISRVPVRSSTPHAAAASPAAVSRWTPTVSGEECYCGEWGP